MTTNADIRTLAQVKGMAKSASEANTLEVSTTVEIDGLLYTVTVARKSRGRAGGPYATARNRY